MAKIKTASELSQDAIVRNWRKAILSAMIDKGVNQKDISIKSGLEASAVSRAINYPDKTSFFTFVKILSALGAEVKINVR